MADFNKKYKIFIDINQTGDPSAGIAKIIGALTGLKVKAGDVKTALSDLSGPLAKTLVGAAAIGAGMGLVTGAMKMADAAKGLNDAQTAMFQAGLSQAEVASATSKAWQIASNTMGSKVDDNVKAIAHLRAAFGDLNEAEAVAPKYIQTAIALHNLVPGSNGEQEAFTLNRVIEMNGSAQKVDPVTHKASFDPKMYEHSLNFFTAMVASGQGKLNPSMLFDFMRRGSIAAKGLSETGLKNAAGFIQELGGAQAGTALMAANRTFMSGVMKHSLLENLEGLGLVDKSKVKTGKGGGISFTGDHLTDAKGNHVDSLFTKDFFGWGYSVFLPALIKAGYTDKDDQLKHLEQMGFTTSVVKALSQVITGRAVDQKEAQNVTTAQQVDQYKEQQTHNYGQAQENYKKSLENLEIAFGQAAIPVLIPLFNSLTATIQSVTAWVTAHPNWAKAIVVGMGILGVTLIAFGAVMIGVVLGPIALAAAGWIAANAVIVGAVLVIAGIFTYLAVALAGSWPQIKKAFIGIYDDFLHSMQGYAMLGRWVAVQFSNIWNSFWTGAQTLFNNLLSWFVNLPQNVWATLNHQPMAAMGGPASPKPLKAPPSTQNVQVNLTVQNTFDKNGVHSMVKDAVGVGKPAKGPTNTNGHNTFQAPGVQGAR